MTAIKLILFMTTIAVAVALAAPLRAGAAASIDDDGDEPALPLTDNAASVEAPVHPAEFPYPGAKETGFKARRPIDDDAPTQPNPNLPRPLSVGEDGSYQYDLTAPADEPARNPLLPKPPSINSEGQYEYGKPDKPAIPPNPMPEQERPIEIATDGYHYKLEHSTGTQSASMRFGILSPPNIVNPLNNVHFSDIYGQSPQAMLLFDYEWRVLRSFGRLGVKVGSGFMTATGTGRFADPAKAFTEQAREQFTFLLFPNTARLTYRFQFAEKQIFVPYVEGGAGFFTFMETRDDNMPAKYGGAAVAVAAGGILLNLDSLDSSSMSELDNEYGINHVYFNLEASQILGLNSKYDFTSSVINGGIVVDF